MIDHDKARATKVARAANMREHVERLAAIHSVTVTEYTGGGVALRSVREIHIRPVAGVSTYYTALHELGHLLGAGRSAPKLEAEANAWEFALAHAIYPPTPGVRKMIRRCLRSYLARHERMARRRRVRWPEREHAFWELADVEAIWSKGTGAPTRIIYHGEPGQWGSVSELV